jgi:hypothetical protein
MQKVMVTAQMMRRPRIGDTFIGVDAIDVKLRTMECYFSSDLNG